MAKLRLHFESDLAHQLEAVEAVCGLFRGQERNRTEFTVAFDDETSDDRDSSALDVSRPGIGNRLRLSDERMLENLRDVQLRNGLKPAERLESMDFTVEMETGTGKTYVYLRTVLELHQRYGFTKFVVVVPSIAIKEGVHSSLRLMREHFKALYGGVGYDAFAYDSSRLGEVRDFATGDRLQIMVMTVGAINKQYVNKVYQGSETTGGEAPIEFVRRARPVIIVDEPQSVDGPLENGKGREGLDAMDPLCTLRYSATHATGHHMVYRLDAIAAYQRRLVKEIEVAAATVEPAFTKPYVRFVRPGPRHGAVTAVVELNVMAGHRFRRMARTVSDGDRLQDITDSALYEGLRIGTISLVKGQEYVELVQEPAGRTILPLGAAHNSFDETALDRELIRRTIKEHLDKELRLRHLGIKVLSLFFIKHVDQYRTYDENGDPVKGEYARIFEEEYTRAIGLPEHRTLFGDADVATLAADAHEGYFSKDKKGAPTDTSETTRDGRESARLAYELIMRDKERLLSLSEPLKFIFSHSALREGWDNPNVFQVCTLRDMNTERQRRQTIGRGLRLCVNQDGQRVEGFDVNTLTVIATESYEDFAAGLQKELEESSDYKFGVVESHEFAGAVSYDEDGGHRQLGTERSLELWDALRARGYVDARGAVQDLLRVALREHTLVIPEPLDAWRGQIEPILRERAGTLPVRNADEKTRVPTKPDVVGSAEFQAMWERIRYGTTYRVAFSEELLVAGCVDDLKAMPAVPTVAIQIRKAKIAIDRGGVASTRREGTSTTTVHEADVDLPDLLTALQDRTRLTRRTIGRILTGAGERLPEFRRDPQRFIEMAADVINQCKGRILVDGIRYRRLDGGDRYSQELFDVDALHGCPDGVGRYVELPPGFTIPTPLGDYNPGWAVLIETADGDDVYFVTTANQDSE